MAKYIVKRMEPPGEHRTGTARMRHREDDTLLFPRRPNENLSLDVDSGRQSRVFSENIASGGEMNMYNNNKGSQSNARIFVIGGFCCFLFLLATVSIYSSLNQQDNVDIRAIDEQDIDNDLTSEDEINEESTLAETGSEDNLVDDNAEPSEDVIEEGDDISDATIEQGDKNIFVMEVNGVTFEIGISKDGDFDLPEGLILNPKVREHWLLIEKTLGMDDYEDDSVESAGDGPENNLEAPLSVEDDEIDKVEVPEPSGNEQPVRMPEGLLFDAPPASGEHEHGEGCDPISVDVGDGMKELAAGDELLEDGEQNQKE